MSASTTHVVWFPTGAHWDLEPAVDEPCRGGGSRTLHELAVALSVLGREVEVRGSFEAAELRRLATAAGCPMPRWADDWRAPGPGDVVVLPEGLQEPLQYGLPTWSGARVVLLALAPPGLFGWSFAGGWSPPSTQDVDPDAVGRPEQLAAAAGLGFELWTHMPRLAAEARGAGLRCRFIGNGVPCPYPPAPVKEYDIATLTANRWASEARQLAAELAGECSWLEIPPGDNASILRALGRARIVIHPARIEGHSRVAQEARSQGTVPIMLASNRYAVGAEPRHGALTVRRLEDMAGAVRELLADPDRLAALARRGVASVAEQTDWTRYLGRVRDALVAPACEDPARPARAELGARLRERESTLLTQIAGAQAALAATVAERDEARAAHRAAEASRAEAAAQLEAIFASHLWRVTRAAARLRGAARGQTRLAGALRRR